MTLIEIIIVMALVGGLMAVVMGQLMSGQANAKVHETELMFRQLQSSLQMYRLAAGKMPTSEQGLNALIERPEGVAGWRGPYCEPNMLRDPWDQPIQYTLEGHTARFSSAGPDEQFGTADDIVFPEPKDGAKTAAAP
jgi:general secretion pathway protein G